MYDIYILQVGQFRLPRVISVAVISVPYSIIITNRKTEIQPKSVSIAHVLNCYAGLKCPALGNNLPQANVCLSVTMAPHHENYLMIKNEEHNIKGPRNTYPPSPPHSNEAVLNSSGFLIKWPQTDQVTFVDVLSLITWCLLSALEITTNLVSDIWSYQSIFAAPL